MEPLEWAASAVDVVFGLVLLVAPLALLWRRSRAAALLGASAGVPQLLASLIFVVVAQLPPAESFGARVAIRLVALASHIASFAALIAMVVTLARAPKAGHAGESP